MKFLFNHNPGGSVPVRLGIMNALRAIGHECQWRVQEQKSIFDVLDETKYDVLIIPSYSLNDAILRRIKESPELTVVLVGSNYGPLDNEIDSEKYPILKITEEEKVLVSKLKEVSPKSNIVVCNYTGRYLEDCMSNWRSLGFEPKCLMNAADTFTYIGGQVKDHYMCDISMISGKWGYKSRNLDKFFLPLCHPVGKFNIKVWGWGWELVPQYLGQIDEGEVKHVFASTKITINIHEPHSTVYGIEATERMYKAIVGGSLVVSDYVKTIEDDICPELPMAKTLEELEGLVKDYLMDEDKRTTILTSLQRHILQHHTYLDRVADLFGYLGLNEEKVRAIEVKGNHLGQNILPN